MSSVLRTCSRFTQSGILSVLSGNSSNGRSCALPYFGSEKKYSTSTKIKVDLDNSNGVAVLQFQIPPVNSLNLNTLTELAINLEKLELDRSCRGVIITSALPRVFSAGLDILEMYQKSPEHCAEFWKALQEVWLKLYGSSKVTIAAINGNSPAGGCLLSMCCDYRIMAENPRYSIGLNETKLGMSATFWIKDTMANVIGHRETEKGLQLGFLYSAPEALKVGLVDELVPEEKVLSTAAEAMSKWFAIPDHARQISKSMMRKPTIDKLLAGRDADAASFADFITKDSIQKSLGIYMEMLKKRKS